MAAGHLSLPSVSQACSLTPTGSRFPCQHSDACVGDGPSDDVSTPHKQDRKSESHCCPPVQLLAGHDPGCPLCKRRSPGPRPSGPPCLPCLKTSGLGRFRKRGKKGRPEISIFICGCKNFTPTCQGWPIPFPYLERREPLPSPSHFWFSWGVLCPSCP